MFRRTILASVLIGLVFASVNSDTQDSSKSKETKESKDTKTDDVAPPTYEEATSAGYAAQ